MPRLKRLIFAAALIVLVCPIIAESDSAPKLDTSSLVESATVLQFNTVNQIDAPCHSDTAMVPELQLGDTETSLCELIWREGANWLLLFFAILTVIVGFKTYTHQTRPILTFGLGGNPRGFIIQPILKNLSDADAELVVIMKLIVDGVVYPCEKDDIRTAYGGNEVWYAPAKSKLNGNINLWPKLREILDSKGIESLYRPTIDKKEREIFLETSIQYRRWYDGSTWISRLIWKWGLNSVYNPPLQRWQFSLERHYWVLVPNFKQPQTPYTGDTTIFNQEPEKRQFAN